MGTTTPALADRPARLNARVNANAVVLILALRLVDRRRGIERHVAEIEAVDDGDDVQAVGERPVRAGLELLRRCGHRHQQERDYGGGAEERYDRESLHGRHFSTRCDPSQASIHTCCTLLRLLGPTARCGPPVVSLATAAPSRRACAPRARCSGRRPRRPCPGRSAPS